MDAQIYYAIGFDSDNHIQSQACDDVESAKSHCIQLLTNGCNCTCVRDAEQKTWAVFFRKEDTYADIALGDVLDMRNKEKAWGYRCIVDEIDITPFIVKMHNIYNPKKVYFVKLNPPIQ